MRFCSQSHHHSLEEIPVVMWDERFVSMLQCCVSLLSCCHVLWGDTAGTDASAFRLSTQAVSRTLKNMGGSKYKDKHVTKNVDTMAAACILQSALSALHNMDSRNSGTKHRGGPEL